jgi:hypothetical protein
MISKSRKEALGEPIPEHDQMPLVEAIRLRNEQITLQIGHSYGWQPGVLSIEEELATPGKLRCVRLHDSSGKLEPELLPRQFWKDHLIAYDPDLALVAIYPRKGVQVGAREREWNYYAYASEDRVEGDYYVSRSDFEKIWPGTAVVDSTDVAAPMTTARRRPGPETVHDWHVGGERRPVCKKQRAIYAPYREETSEDRFGQGAARRLLHLRVLRRAPHLGDDLLPHQAAGPGPEDHEGRHADAHLRRGGGSVAARTRDRGAGGPVPDIAPYSTRRGAHMSVVNYDHHSAHSVNLFCASTAMWVVEKVLGLRQPVGAPAHRGVAVENGVTHGLMNPDAAMSEWVKVAMVTYDTLMALSPDARREKYRETIDDMVRLALDELRPYGPPSRTQGLVEWKPEGLRLPIIGFFDFRHPDLKDFAPRPIHRANAVQCPGIGSRWH